MKLYKAKLRQEPIIATMKLQQLKEFCVIAQCESLTKAAKMLHTSQPSLSRNLRALEEELNAELFTRTGRNIVLNDAGRFAFERIAPALINLEGVKQDVSKFIYNDSRSIDVFLREPIAGLDEVLCDFKKRYPEIKLRISSQEIRRLKNTQPNLTLFSSPITRDEGNLLLLGEERFCLMVAKTNPLANRESVELTCLGQQPLICSLQGSLYETTVHILQDAGVEPNVAMEDNNRERIMRYVAEGIGVALAPEKTWIQGWEETVAAVPLSDCQAKRYLYLKWPEESLLNWSTLKLRASIVEHLNRTCGFTCQP